MSSLLEKSLDEIIGSGSSRPERNRVCKIIAIQMNNGGKEKPSDGADNLKFISFKRCITNKSYCRSVPETEQGDREFRSLPDVDHLPAGIPSVERHHHAAAVALTRSRLQTCILI